MLKTIKTLTVLVMLLVTVTAAAAEDVSREQLKGLDEQVQEIKGDVLAIAAELSQLEEKLLYPSHTQVAIFISLAAGETMRLDAVEIALDDRTVAHHLYSFKELEALRLGGVQRIYSGNLRTGNHPLKVTMRAKSAGGSDIVETELFTLHKEIGPGIVEVTLADGSINFTDK